MSIYSLEGFHVGLVTENPITTLGGVERFSLSLAQELKQRGARISIYNRSLLTGFKSHWYDRYGIGMARRTWALGLVVADIAKRDRVDVIIQNGISGWSLRHAAPEVPRIVVHHGTWRGVAPHLLKPSSPVRTRLANRVFTSWLSGGIERWTAATAKSVAVSLAVAEELRELYGIDASVVQNGIDLEHFIPIDRQEARKKLGLRIPPGQIIISFTGRLEYRKGADILYELSRRAAEETPEAVFLLAVDRAPQGWPSNVVALENVSYERMPLVYSASDVFVFPSRYEGCSYSVIEAMACGVPPILSNVGHAKDIREQDKILGEFIIDELSPDVFWTVLTRLIREPQQRQTLGTLARRYAEEHNSLKAMGDAYQKLICETISSHKALMEAKQSNARSHV
ncbi:MAG TPA: glycosyltransferase family 4 protein [Syntrophothermus lipocalidus]|nr:glycosyltransferase family 4 protein [Syntrophothermus lipocalidus]